MPRHSSLARLLQASLFVQVTAALAWALWRWPAAPWHSVLGVLLVASLGPIVLAIEAVLSAIVSGADGRVVAPSLPQMLRAWLLESAHLYATFGWRQPWRWRAVDDHLEPACEGRTAVVLVHGFMCNRGFWNAWMRALRKQGHGCVAVNLEPAFAGIDDYAAIIESAVRRAEACTQRPVLVICHSMGGLAARAWWRAHGAGRTLAGLVTIATPHAGTWLARFSQRANGRQMRLQSAWLRELALHEARAPLPATTCWYSNCDNVVFPAATAMLHGAHNRFVPGQPHVALGFHPQVIAGCLALLRELDAPRQGEFVTSRAPEIG